MYNKFFLTSFQKIRAEPMKNIIKVNKQEGKDALTLSKNDGLS